MQKMGKNCRDCMEWQEHCYWSHMDDDNKHFFKLMVGDFTETMSIPSRFAKNFNGHISEDINLRSPSGKTWSIGVAVGADGVVLGSGWKEFVSAHSIEEGDHLLFKYSGVSSFDVLIFDSTGCEKTSPHFAVDNAYGRTENHHPLQPPPPPPLSYGDDANLQMTLHGNSSKSISKACKHRKYHDSTAHAEQDEQCEQDAAAEEEEGYYFCKNGPVSEYHLSEEDKEEIRRVRVPVEPGNPVFVQVMHQSHVRGNTSYLVGVSSEFAARHLEGGGAAAAREVVLERASRTGEWRVRYVRLDNRRGLCGRGWCEFAVDAGLVGHDVCLFELMGDRRVTTMTVHLLRRVRGRYVPMR